MLNTDDFTLKLQTILDYYGLTASAFADKIGVQRSSLSHLLSGRNKPSLEFVLKISEVFKEVDLYWLLQGKGEFPKNEDNNIYPEIINEKNKSFDLFQEEKPKDSESSFIKDTQLHTASTEESKILENTNESIDKIVIFYSNGTFKSYNPKK
ncbi:helix-turn-helix domain-containing protein [Flavobacterium okayamense]|uniref:Transcriptional regulator n=1 Tax=Flavobacterium okayamense TaxID=2830782 RepID=A0ABM7SEC8_9FLAO|nr:helix-turn-helix transcriptional regulator [Flavobacterium okayamense]BCY29149.1 transcriptional regulator [Flavobacterium okayamense]